jgi:arginine exporter protein ArgO
MPQLIAIGLIGGVVWYGYKAFKREMDRINTETRAAEKKKTAKTILKQDKDGVYRPMDDE